MHTICVARKGEPVQLDEGRLASLMTSEEFHAPSPAHDLYVSEGIFPIARQEHQTGDRYKGSVDQRNGYNGVVSV